MNRCHSKVDVIVLSRSRVLRAAFATLILATSFTVGRATYAQATPDAAARAVSQQPDVQVVVAPLGDKTWGISEVYPGAVAHGVVQSRMGELAKTGGWNLYGSTAVKDESLNGSTKRRDGRPLDAKGEDADVPGNTTMSSISISTPDKVVDMAAGTMNVVPFLVSLRDLSHVNIVYLIPAGSNFPFHGLRHYEDSHVSIDLTARQGTYFYTANIKDHALTAETLAGVPQFQDAANASATPAVEHGRSGVYTTGLVIGFAVGAGLLVYLWAMRLGGGSRRDNRG